MLIFLGYIIGAGITASFLTQMKWLETTWDSDTDMAICLASIFWPIFMPGYLSMRICNKLIQKIRGN